MKKIFLSIFTLFIFLSCQTTSKSSKNNYQGQNNFTNNSQESNKQNSSVQEPVQSSVQSYVDEEYARSVNTVNVSKSTFTEDKAEIMSIIEKLEDVLLKYDYNTWKSFIDAQSVSYWSSPKNLSKASSMLPVKGLKMTSLRDYFTHVFVPSRRGRKVDEIRYSSTSDVKAVQVNKDTDVIYYHFKKINNKWYVTLPPLQN